MRARSFLIGVAVLRDNGRDPLGVEDGEPEPCRRTVIKDVYREPIEADDFTEALDDAGDVDWCVWPHDNAIIALGFRRYGFAAEAMAVARSISDAALRSVRPR
jgi:hypothetical protein